MTRFRDRADFAPTIDAAAERLRTSPGAVEKDYWASEALRALAAAHHADFVFKGGTSLSKGYRLIERISEDVDILVIPGGRGRNDTHRLMKDMAETAEAALGGQVTVEGSRTGEHRNVRVGYPAVRGLAAGLSEGVLLEIGIRGGPYPSESLRVGCLLGDTIEAAGTDLGDFEDLQPFDVDGLHPGRTLLEKLALVHSKLSAEPTVDTASRYGRHYYDIYQLLGYEPVLTLLSDRAEVDKILASIDEVTQANFGHGEVRPAEGWASSPAFDPRSQRLRAGYDQAMAVLYFGAGQLPSFEAVCARIAEMRCLL